MFHPAINPFLGKFYRSAWIALVALCIIATAALADNPMLGPQLTSVFPAGGRQASHFSVAIAGTDLDDATSLVFSHPGLSGVPKLFTSKVDHAVRAIPGQFEVTISGNVPSGLYEVRAAGQSGISNPRTFVVGNLNEIVDRNPSDRFAEAREIPLESTVNGVMRPEHADYYKFTAKKGQRIVLESWARRIDSLVDPRIVLYDSAGRELARAKERIHRDLLLDFIVPRDGGYVAKIYDFLYQGGPNYPYRLTISTAPRLDFVMPPSGLAGSKAKYSLFGRNLPGGKPTGERTASGTTLERLDVDIQLPAEPKSHSLAGFPFAEATQFAQDSFAYRLQTPRGETNPVNIYFAAAPVVREHEPNDTPAQAQKISPPCEIAGQFNPRGDQDWFEFVAHRGDAWTIEVFSQRLGLTTDPFLLIQRVIHQPHGQDKMIDVVQADDSSLDIRHSATESFLKLSFEDPLVHFVAPADGTYRILVRDLYSESRGSPEFVYRLAIHHPAPDFRALALEESPSDTDGQERMNLWSGVVHRGQSTAVNVLIARQDGFSSPVELSVEGLPKGITCTGAMVGPGSDLGTLVFTADDKPSANVAAWGGPVRVLAKANMNGHEITHDVAVTTAVWPVEKTSQDPVEFRLTPQLVLATSGGSTPEVNIEVGDGKAVETAPGATAKIPVKVARTSGSKGALKCYLVGLCPGMNATELDVPANVGKMSVLLNITSQLPPGKYSLALRAYSFVNCRNNAEEADRATARLKSLEKIAAELSRAAKKADADKKVAEKIANRDDSAVRRALESLAAAVRTEHQSDDHVKNAGKSLPRLEKAASDAAAQLRAAENAHAGADRKATDPHNSDFDGAVKELAETAQAVRKERVRTQEEFAKRDAVRAAVQSAIAQRDIAERVKTAAERKLTEAIAAAKIATAARTAAEIEARTAVAKSHLPDEEKTIAAEVARRATEIAQPRDYTLLYYARPLELIVNPAPLSMRFPTELSAKAGQKIDVPLDIERHFGFADVVRAELVAQSSAAGIHAGEISIPSRQSQGKLPLAIDPKAKPGQYKLDVRARVTFNNQPSQLVEPLLIKISPSEEPKDKGKINAAPAAKAHQSKK